MEANQRTRKRKQPQTPSPNPLSGIFTRQKSQIFFHNNRSGKSRPDPVRKTTSFPSNRLTNISSPMIKCQIQNSPHIKEEEDDDEAIYHISIKDLRARRVFSKPLVQKEAQSKDVGNFNEVESGKNLNPNLHSELNDDKLDKCGDESCGFEKSSEEIRLDESLLADRSDSATNLGNTDYCGGETENPILLMSANSDLWGLDNRVDSTVENPTSSMVEGMECNARVGHKEEVSNFEKSSLSKEVCNSRVNLQGEESNGINPSSLAAPIGRETLDGVKEEKFDVGLNCIGNTSDYLSPNLCSKVLKGANGEVCEGFNEEIVQTTPPDAVIQIQQSDDRNGSALHNPNASSTSPAKKISPTKSKKNLSSNSKRYMVLKPCTRMKVFKAPNSFSYRRLLPYLLDMAKDTPSAPKATLCPKKEADAGEKTTVSSSEAFILDTPKLEVKPMTNLPCSSFQEESSDRKEEEKVSMEPKASDLKTETTVLESPVNCSQDKSLVNWVSPETHIENSVDNDSQGGVSLGEERALGNVGTPKVSLILKPDQVDSSLASKGSTEEASKKDANVVEAPCQLSVFVEGECRTAHVELKAGESSISVFHSSPKLEAVVSSGVPASSLTKGILKRNPRGCRGICNCLNCASFRLNAGKAFEFSGNQMLDTEELVLNMMKELSNLRIMLEKSVSIGNNHAILPVDQVQEASRRASNMEDVARNRLSQMKEDLYVHCRTKSLERPRVNFSSNMEEMLTGKSSKQIERTNASRSLAL